MPGDQPDFAPVTPTKKKQWLETNDSYMARLDEFMKADRERKRQERLRASVASFVLSIGDVTGIPLVFNLKTRQVAVREDALGVNTQEHARRFTSRKESFARARAADGLALLKSNSSEYRELPFAYDPEAELPVWFFMKSNEPRGDTGKVMRRVRVRRFGSRFTTGISDLFKELGVALFGIFGFIVVAITFAVMAWIAWYFFSGIAGLLEFGRKQL